MIIVFSSFFRFLFPLDVTFLKEKEKTHFSLLPLSSSPSKAMWASLSTPRTRRPVSLLSLVVLLMHLPCNLTVAATLDLSPSSRLASATTPTTTMTPSIPPLPRAEELCSLAKQYAVPLKLCSADSGTLEIDKGSLLAAVAAVGASAPPPSSPRQLPSSSQEPPEPADAAVAAALKPATSAPDPQSLDALRQQLDRATIQAASYLDPPFPGSSEAAALAAAERNATSARYADFKSSKTRGGLIGAAVSVTVVSVLLVVLAGKKQKTGKWL